MELELQGDQELFVETTRRFLEAEAPISEVRRLAPTSPVGSIASGGDAGRNRAGRRLLVPEHLGGGSVSGNGVLDLVLVAEEMGRLVAPGPLLPTNVVVAAIVWVARTPWGSVLVVASRSPGDTVGAWAFGERGRSARTCGCAPRSPGDRCGLGAERRKKA